MSNIFKSSSRFAALAEDIPAFREKIQRKDKQNRHNNFDNKNDNVNSFKTDNSFKNKMHSNYEGSRYKRLKERYDAEDKAKKEFEKQEQERRIKESLQIENFPELVQPKQDIVINIEQNYIEKLKKFNTIQNENVYIDPDLRNLQPGWILLKKDTLTNQTIIKGRTNVVENPPISEQVIASNVFHGLDQLHEERTQSYIELNGYDDWERVFKSPNWREWEDEYDDDINVESDEEDESEYESIDDYFDDM